MTEKPLEQMGLRELRAIARQQMPAEAWHHFNGAAESKATFYRNPRSFQRYLFRQRVFHDITDPDITTELFGHKLPIPALIAPVGSFSLIGDQKEREVAEGAGRVGAMVFCSQAAKFNPQNWRDATKSPLVFMAYMNRGREEVSEYAKLAQDLGFAAVGITMDTVRPVKIGDEVPLSTKDGKPRRGHVASPKDIEWMKQQVSLPVVIKGMMSAEDARTAVNAGADAVLVSNHGGGFSISTVPRWKPFLRSSMPWALRYPCYSTAAYGAAAISSKPSPWVRRLCSRDARLRGASVPSVPAASSACLLSSAKR
jgi:isopentenyl diphosphate isomerase/L-lactate dehydrogenase-like FMN-dependent dehydrogenase